MLPCYARWIISSPWVQLQGRKVIDSKVPVSEAAEIAANKAAAELLASEEQESIHLNAASRKKQRKAARSAQSSQSLKHFNFCFWESKLHTARLDGQECTFESTWQEYAAYQRSDMIKYNQMELSTHKIILEIRSSYKVRFVFCQFSWCTLYDSVLRLQGCLGRFAWAPFNISARGCKPFIKLTMLEGMQRTAYPATDFEFLDDRQRA